MYEAPGIKCCIKTFCSNFQILELEKPKNKEPGFHSVYIKIAGIDKYAGHIVVARAQNEIYAALNNDDKNAKMYGCTPDSISMVDPTTGIENGQPCTCTGIQIFMQYTRLMP